MLHNTSIAFIAAIGITLNSKCYRTQTMKYILFLNINLKKKSFFLRTAILFRTMLLLVTVNAQFDLPKGHSFQNTI